MTRASLREYAATQRGRYPDASRAEKRRLLDEVVAVTGLHRKAAIRLLRHAPRPRAQPGPGGRPRVYGPEVATAAEFLWQASGRIGAHRLQPFVSELLDRLLRCGELTLAPAVDTLVRQASRPTLARLLGPARARYPRRGATITRPGSVLRHEIPIRTFTEWTDVRPGFLEVDLVAHCGSPRAFTCVPSAPWTSPPPGLSWSPSGARAKTVSGGPSPTSERACPCRCLAWTATPGRSSSTTRCWSTAAATASRSPRSRPWKKNDSAHVEQKNGAVVRQLIGYDRFASRAAYGVLTRVYRLARLPVNFFQPVEQLVTKTRHGARIHRVYDRAQTPSVYAPLASCRPTPAGSSTPSTSRSTRSSFGAPSSARSTDCGSSPRPTLVALQGIPRSPPPSGRHLLDAPRRWLR